MARYLLETTCLVLLGRNAEPFASRLMALMARPDQLGVSPINVAEFFAGIPPHEHGPWERLLTRLRYWSIEPADARQGGLFRYSWAREGRVLQVTDTLVAAVAMRVGATIVTENLKDFPMPEVRAVSLLSEEFAF